MIQKGLDLISIIVPVYNVELFLPQCIDSILAQTYTNLEIILVDDGSPDRCGDICDYYAEQDYRIKVIHKTNGGLSDARNSGIENAHGAWLAFVDSDDFVAPTMIETLYIAAVSEKAQLAICNVDCFSEERGIYNSTWKLETGVRAGIDILKHANSIESPGGISPVYVVAWNKLYRQELFESVRYPKGFIHEDEAIAHRLLAECERVASVSKNLYHYRQREDSIMNQKPSPARLDVYTAMADRIAFYYDMGLKTYTYRMQNAFFWGIHNRFYQLWTPGDRDQHFMRCRKATLQILPFYLRRKDISVKEKLAELVFCFCPRYYKKKWYCREEDGAGRE